MDATLRVVVVNGATINVHVLPVLIGACGLVDVPVWAKVLVDGKYRFGARVVVSMERVWLPHGQERSEEGPFSSLQFRCHGEAIRSFCVHGRVERNFVIFLREYEGRAIVALVSSGRWLTLPATEEL